MVRKATDIERDRMAFRVLRSVRGMRNSDIARKAGVSAATVAALRRPVNEGGTRFPRSITLQAIARVGGLHFVLIGSDDVVVRHEDIDERRAHAG